MSEKSPPQKKTAAAFNPFDIREGDMVQQFLTAQKPEYLNDSFQQQDFLTNNELGYITFFPSQPEQSSKPKYERQNSTIMMLLNRPPSEDESEATESYQIQSNPGHHS